MHACMLALLGKLHHSNMWNPLIQERSLHTDSFNFLSAQSNSLPSLKSMRMFNSAGLLGNYTLSLDRILLRLLILDSCNRIIMYVRKYVHIYHCFGQEGIKNLLRSTLKIKLCQSVPRY
jgi:hypothetical protein